MTGRTHIATWTPSRSRRQRGLLGAFVLAAAALAALLGLAAPAAGADAPAPAELSEGYGYFRTVEGRARLTGLTEDGDDQPIDVETNYPLLTGDRLWVEPGSRIEALMADGALLRAGGSTEVFFAELARSADGPEDAVTRLRLFGGELQLDLDRATGRESLEIEADGAALYLSAPGLYYVESDGRALRLVVRDGWAEVGVAEGASMVRAGEEAIVGGRAARYVEIRAAGSLASLERWGDGLTSDGYRRAPEHVDGVLAYAAAPLADSGAWVSIRGRYAWRPYVGAGWRPFTDGTWIYTPSGLTWVPYEPWGWLTSHYGTWDYVPGYGWAWFPGYAYSPAWVYWYWGPLHVAWVPAGYYSHFYGPRLGFWGFRFGVYGWAGGYWDDYAYWTFCPTRYFGHRGYHHHWRSGAELGHRDRQRVVPRGIITTDTRGIEPRHWGKPNEIFTRLERTANLGAGGGYGGGRTTTTLTDVTSFVKRSPTLPGTVREAVVDRGGYGGRVPGGTAVIDRGNAGTPGGSRSTIVERSRGDGAAGPWKVAKPLAVTPDRGGAASSRTDAGASRGTLERFADKLYGRDPGGESAGRAIAGRERVEIGGKSVVMPPSPRPGAFDRRPDTDVTYDRPVRRILDGIRSRSDAPAERPSAAPSRGGDRGEYSKPQSGSSRGESARPPQRSSEPPRSTRPPSRSAPSKSVGPSRSSGSSSRSSARSGSSGSSRGYSARGKGKPPAA